MSNREIRFRESFRGYNRDDVTAYIEQLNIIFSRKETELRAHVADLEAKLNEQASIPMPSHTDDEWNNISTALNEAQNELARLQSELHSTQTANNEKNEENARLYDSMSAQVGNIIISANANADKIVTEANENAEKIKNEADKYAACVRSEADKYMNEAINGINEKVRGFAIECVTQYGTIVGEANVKLESIANNIKTGSDNILASLENKIKEIDSKLSLHSEN